MMSRPAFPLNFKIATADKIQIVLVLVAFYLFWRATGKACSRRFRKLRMLFLADVIDGAPC